jgi:hypothetical protein
MFILSVWFMIFAVWGIAWCIHRVSRYPSLEPETKRAKVKRKRKY